MTRKKSRETRTADHLTLLEIRNFKTATATKSFIPRAISSWNKLPLTIREITVNKQFKIELKSCIKNNITLK